MKVKICISATLFFVTLTVCQNYTFASNTTSLDCLLKVLNANVHATSSSIQSAINLQTFLEREGTTVEQLLKHRQVRINPVSRSRQNIAQIERKQGNELHEFTILYDSNNRPTAVRTRFESSAEPEYARIQQIRFYKIDSTGKVLEIPTHLEIIRGSFTDNSPVQGPWGQNMPPVKGKIIEGNSSAQQLKAMKDVVYDPNSIFVGMDEYALITRKGPSADGSIDQLSYHTVFSAGYGPCTGFMIEGKDFSVVSHLVGPHRTSPATIVPFLLSKVKESGHSMKNLKVRIIGGSSKNSINMPEMLKIESEKLGLTIEEVDILGDETRSFGFTLGCFGSCPSVFRIK